MTDARPQSRIVFFLMNVHNRHRFIYFARVRFTESSSYSCFSYLFHLVWAIPDRTLIPGGLRLVTSRMGLCSPVEDVHDGEEVR